jgi:nucleoside-diphosphate-sugar epimerase
MAARALITGATGLLGHYVLAAWDVPGLDPVPAPIEGSGWDLLEPGAATRMLDKVRPEVVVHLAWAASGTPDYRTSPDNPRWVEATVELAAACLDRGIRFLGTGTVVESETPDPADLYATAKHEIRRRLTADIDGARIAWIQPFYVFDPEVGRPAVVADSLRARAEGRSVALRSPHSAHDFVHAADVGRAVVTVVRADLRGQLPMGSGRLHQVCDVVTALGVPWLPAVDADLATSHSERAADPASLLAAGWRPTATEEFFGQL